MGTAIFSFHPIKNITTGEGGMTSTDDPVLAERLRRLRFHGLGVDAFDRETQGRRPQAEVLEPGYKANLTDIAAVLGLGQLARLPERNHRRAALAERYLELFRDIEEVRPLARPDYPHDHSWHLFVVRLLTEKAGLSRDEFMAELKRENIGTGLHFRAAHLHAWYREHRTAWRGDLPATEWNSDRILSLPLFPDMSDEDPPQVVEAIRRVLSRNGRRR
jgi:UDP-4-amino-4-deoxy-L-arabinose-oxoglutarate aminotransferase